MLGTNQMAPREITIPQILVSSRCVNGSKLVCFRSNKRATVASSRVVREEKAPYCANSSKISGNQQQKQRRERRQKYLHRK